jgi:hypothetical protein
MMKVTIAGSACIFGLLGAVGVSAQENVGQHQQQGIRSATESGLSISFDRHRDGQGRIRRVLVAVDGSQISFNPLLYHNGDPRGELPAQKKRVRELLSQILGPLIASGDVVVLSARNERSTDLNNLAVYGPAGLVEVTPQGLRHLRKSPSVRRLTFIDKR